MQQRFSLLLPLGVLVLSVHAQAPVYGQCGGTGWTGATSCASGSTCTYSNDWYSQCLPGSAATTTSRTSPPTSPPASSPPSASKTTTQAGSTSKASAAAPTDVTFCLAGDSTTASNAGWGDGFCLQTLLAGVACTNLAQSGATTGSFIANDTALSWNATLDCVRKSKNKARTFVTIQFGHNDQKRGDSYKPIYLANLERMARDVVALGAHPILVTPLSRRNFVGGVINDILEPWAVYVRQAAAATGQPYIELLQTSITYLNKIGSAAAHRLDFAAGDSTHLNANGKTVFSRMVADLIKAKNIVNPNPFKADPTLSSQIAKGIASF